MIDVGYAGVIGADRIADGDPLYGHGFSGRRGEGRHLRAGQLPRLPPVRAGDALGRELGRAAGGARRGHRLRPADARRPAAAGPADAARARRDGRWRWRSAGPGPPTPTRCSPSSPTATTGWCRSSWWRRCSALTARRRAGRPSGRGLAVGLGAAAKFAPLALAPLMAAGTGERRWRDLLPYAAGARGAVACSRSPSCPTAGCASSTTARSATRPAAPRRSAPGASSPRWGRCRPP